MQRRTNAVAEVVHELLASGFKGQLRPGDTIGLWTFNEAVSAGQFPLQHARADNRQEIADQAADFIRAQRFEKAPSLKVLMPMLAQVVQDSRFITLVFISSGDAPLFGTAYDAAINTIYEEWRVRQAKAAKPIVTILRARQGKLTDFGVHPVPFAFEMPPLPPELVQIAAAASGQKSAASKVNRPLIVTGKRPEASAEPEPRFTPMPSTSGTSVLLAPPEAEQPAEAGAQVLNSGQSSEAAQLTKQSIPDSAAVSEPSTGESRFMVIDSGNIADQLKALTNGVAEPTVSPPPTAEPTERRVTRAPKAPAPALEAGKALPIPEAKMVQEAKPAVSQPRSGSVVPIKSPEVAKIPTANPRKAGETAATAAAGPKPTVSLAAELEKLSALPEPPVPTPPVSHGQVLTSRALMVLGFGCASMAAVGLLVLGFLRRRHGPAPPRTSIVTRSLQRHTLG